VLGIRCNYATPPALAATARLRLAVCTDDSHEKKFVQGLACVKKIKNPSLRDGSFLGNGFRDVGVMQL
jgi:hypothetical protein